MDEGGQPHLPASGSLAAREWSRKSCTEGQNGTSETCRDGVPEQQKKKTPSASSAAYPDVTVDRLEGRLSGVRECALEPPLPLDRRAERPKESSAKHSPKAPRESRYRTTLQRNQPNHRPCPMGNGAISGHALSPRATPVSVAHRRPRAWPDKARAGQWRRRESILGADANNHRVRMR
ncbi:hypothetical protein DPSP01_000730 [Paraphaeosphaeria sporulosa]